MQGIVVEYLNNCIDSNGNWLEEYYNWADRIFIIGDYVNSSDKKVSVKHKLGLTGEMVSWLNEKYEDEYFSWEEDYYSSFARWYISEKFDEIEKFITWFNIRTFQNILIVTDDCPYETHSIRSIIGSILKSMCLKYLTYTNFSEEPIPRRTYFKYSKIYEELQSEVYPNDLYTERGFKVRLYPNKEQEKYLNLNINGCSVLWNNLLGEQVNLEKESKINNNLLKKFDKYEAKKKIVSFKKDPTTDWLKQCDSTALQQTVLELGRAYEDYYYAGTGKGHPKFKSKVNKKRSFTCIQSSNCDNPTIYFTDDGKTRLKIPKLNNSLKCRHRKNIILGAQGAVSRLTITKEANKWYASVLYVNVPIRRKCNVYKPESLLKVEEERAVGIDLGITTYATCVDSKGNLLEIENPKYLNNAEKRLAKLQHSLDRKKTKIKDENGKDRYSKNYNKVSRRIINLHNKVTNKRKNMQNYWSKYITDSYDYIFTENLDIQQLREAREDYLKTKKSKHTRNKNLSDAAFYEFTRQLDYKAMWKGKYSHHITKYFASTRICTYCETPYPYKLQSYIKQWRCLNPDCYTNNTSPFIAIDRDKNAAINILREGLYECGIDIDSCYPAFLNYINAPKATEIDNHKEKSYKDKLIEESKNFMEKIINNTTVKFGK